MKRNLLYWLFFVAFIGNLVVFGNEGLYPSEDKVQGNPAILKAMSYLNANKPDSALAVFNFSSSDFYTQDDSRQYLSVIYDIALVFNTQGDYAKSLQLCQFLDSLIILRDEKKTESRRPIILLTGLNLYKLKKNDEAEKILLYLLKDGLPDTYDSIHVITLKTLGNIEFSKQMLPNALKYYERALNMELSRTEYSPKLVSALYQNMAIGWAQLQERDSAQYYFQKAIKIKEEYLPANDLSLASGYLNYSKFVSNNDLPEALNYIDKAESIYVELFGTDVPALAPLYQNKGSYLILLRNYDQALIYTQMALDLYQKSKQASESVYNRLYLNFGIVFETTGQYNNAIDYLSRCQEKSFSVEQRIKFHRLLGMCYQGLGNDDEARKNYLLAIDESEEFLGENHYQTAACYFRYGSFLSTADDDSGTLNFLNRGLVIYQLIFGDKNRDVSNVLSTLAKYYHRKHNYQQALNYYQQALVSFLPEFNDIDYQVNPTEEQMSFDLNLAFILINKALTLYDNYLYGVQDISDLKLGFETAKLATSRMDMVRSSFGQDNAKLLITSQSAFFYERIIWGANELYNITNNVDYLYQAFEFAEKSKAAVLQSTIREMGAMEQKFIPASIRDEEKKLKSDWVQCQNKLFEESMKSNTDSLYLGQLRNDLHEKNNAYDSLISVLEKEYPRYYNLKYNSSFMSIVDVQNKLAADEAFIEYHLADTLLYTFVIKNDTALIHTVRVNENFADEVTEYVNMLNKPEVSDVLENSYRMAQKGFNLFRQLKLNSPEVASSPNLIVIPDEILQYLSFDALVTELPDKEHCNYKKLDFLINHHILAYSYSGNLFFADSKNHKGKKKVLAIAPDYKHLERMEADSSFLKVRDIDKHLYPLVYSEEEVNYALQVYGGKKITGKDATEDNFKSLAGNFSILHFAMHTIINDKNPLASKLIFSTSSDSLQDGYLNTYEIYNLDLNADLAVLSACNTGSGAISGGEGIMSMARGFIYAGVPGIIMTLWAVEDHSSTTIIKMFYDNLKKGKKKDVALHNAKLDFLNNADQLNSHPYFWAAYVQIGNNDPIYTPLIPQSWLIVIGSMVGIFLIFFIVYRNRKVK